MHVTALIVGLGNPGLRYETTRHNIGFLAVDAMLEAMDQVSAQSGSKFSCELYKGFVGKGMPSCFVVKPQTFMNLSGACVQPLSAWYRIAPERILVLHDDLDIDSGYMRCKCGGGDAGHKGLQSITERLGTPNYYRLRLGIGRPLRGGAVESWVLGGLSQAECDQFATLTPKILDCVRAFVCEDMPLAMRLGTLKPPKPPKAPKQIQEKSEEISMFVSGETHGESSSDSISLKY